MNSLRAGGRCAIEVPRNLLFNVSSGYYTVRAQLLSDFRVEAVIGLPPRALSRDISAPAAIIVFTKPTTLGSRVNETIWFYSLDAVADTRTINGAQVSPIGDLISAFRSREEQHESDNSQITRLAKWP